MKGCDVCFSFQMPSATSRMSGKLHSLPVPTHRWKDLCIHGLRHGITRYLRIGKAIFMIEFDPCQSSLIRLNEDGPLRVGYRSQSIIQARCKKNTWTVQLVERPPGPLNVKVLFRKTFVYKKEDESSTKVR